MSGATLFSFFRGKSLFWGLPIVAFAVLAGRDAFSQYSRWTEAESALRTALVFNFIRFSKFPENSDPEMKVCIFGEDPFRGKLEKLSGQSAHNKKIVVDIISSDFERTRDCHAVFVHSDFYAEFKAAYGATATKPILVIGEGKDLFSIGGMINIKPSKQKLKFEINRSAAKEVGLDFDARFLSLAAEVL